MMLLNGNELKVILEFALEPIFKEYSVCIKEAHISINDKIEIQTVVIYQDHTIDIKVSFLLDYCHGQVCFTDIEGKVEYLFLQLDIMKVLKQILNHENIRINQNSCFYRCLLPIESIQIENHYLNVKLRDSL